MKQTGLKVTTTAPPSRRQYKVRSLNSVCRSKLLAPLNQSGGIQSTPAKTALLPPHGMPLARPWLTLRRHEGSSTPKPWPNWAVKRTPTLAMASPSSWPVLVPCAPSVLRRRLPWALGFLWRSSNITRHSPKQSTFKAFASHTYALNVASRSSFLHNLCHAFAPNAAAQ